jgi:hypothetical protein
MRYGYRYRWVSLRVRILWVTYVVWYGCGYGFLKNISYYYIGLGRMKAQETLTRLLGHFPLLFPLSAPPLFPFPPLSLALAAVVVIFCHFRSVPVKETICMIKESNKKKENIPKRARDADTSRAPLFLHCF